MTESAKYLSAVFEQAVESGTPLTVLLSNGDQVAGKIIFIDSELLVIRVSYGRSDCPGFTDWHIFTKYVIAILSVSGQLDLPFTPGDYRKSQNIKGEGA